NGDRLVVRVEAELGQRSLQLVDRQATAARETPSTEIDVHAAATSFHQLMTQCILQFTHRPMYRRLRKPQLGRSSRKTSSLEQGEESAHLRHRQPTVRLESGTGEQAAARGQVAHEGLR